MDNNEILNTLRSIAKRLDGDRIVTRYTSNEGLVAARGALELLSKINIEKNKESLTNAIETCKLQLGKAIELNDKYVNRSRNTYGEPTACPIATQHAIERFFLAIGNELSQ